VRPPPVAVRRAVLAPLWLPLAAALAGLLLAVAVIGLLIWPLTRGRVARLALFAALYMILDAGLVVACAAVWLRHPSPRRDARRWVAVHTTLLRWVLSTLRAGAGPLLGFRMRLEEPPAELIGGPLLVLARHAGPGDSFTLVELLLSRYRRTPRIVLKEILQWDPGLDIVLSRLSAVFLPSQHTPGDDLPGRLAALARRLGPGDAMLLFPEGGNWTPRRYLRALARLRTRAQWQRAHWPPALSRGQRAADRVTLRQLTAAAADAAANPNVLPPRPAGVLACLAARPDLDVVIVAHTGLEDLVTPGLVWRALPITDRPMTVRWWYEPAATRPADPEGQYQWLRVHWAIVDSWIGARKAQAVAAGFRPEAAGLAREAGGLVPEVGGLVPEVGDLVPEVGDLVPEAGGLGPEADDPAPDAGPAVGAPG
jgi:1-acyl-sn-glycerol-3-phosphate acyltransferase